MVITKNQLQKTNLCLKQHTLPSDHTSTAVFGRVCDLSHVHGFSINSTGIGWGNEFKEEEEEEVCLFVGWFLNVPATCQCISGTDLLRQVNVLPH